MVVLTECDLIFPTLLESFHCNVSTEEQLEKLSMIGLGPASKKKREPQKSVFVVRIEII